ncbi:DUF349 domain-containing protein [Rugamonas rubra]|uniref:DUF349 domain-containing protein n=1 Tax=Rugamonas rubra TaxID=758825 RepID=A0A1I4LJQ7_9BURK|nr:DUF349 domain-containing protein [Rugamonas rubra]SFL91225.1 protein of unknown function [Rugamonas rubra]
MFDFLFKRATDKSAEPQRASAASEASDGAAAQAASRRDEQTARARLLAGDEAAAVELILQSEFAGVRLAAAEHVVSQAALEQVLLAMRNSDRRVAKLMQGRLDAIRYQLAEQQKARTCIAQAERLIQDEKLTPNMVADLDRQWSVTAAAAEQAECFAPLRAALAQRLESQVSLQRAVIDALAELRALPAAGLAPVAAAEVLERLRAGHAAALASAELTSLPKHLLNDVAAALESAGAALQALQQHQAVFDARQAALAEWQAAAPDSLGAEQLRRAWQALGAVPAGELAARQQAELDVVLAAVAAANPPAAPVERGDKARDANAANAANAAKPAKPARAGKEDDQQDNKRFVDTLDALEAALEQGLLHAAAEHDKWLKERKGGRLTAAQSERLAHLRAELKRLGDWARWGGNVSREELVKAVEELAAQGLAMSELAKKVGSMRERWKGLDAVSGHAPKALWERFDAACSAAYAPAAAHFKQLAEERHHNAAKAQALIDEVGAMAGTEHADWKQVAAAAQRLRQVWGRLGTIDRKEKKKFDTAFEHAMTAMMAPLAEQRALEMARREQLIAEVEALLPHDRSTLDVMRHLQERWQEQAKALPLERKAEQALWQRFRAACDHLFAQRKESAHAADSERKVHLHAREAICAGLEAAAFDGEDKAQLAAIAAALRDAASAWHGAGAVPRAAEAKITQRYQAAVAAVQAQADAIKRRAGAAQANALRDKLRLCQALEATLGRDDGAPDGAAAAADWSGRWQALPPLAAEYERALHGRFKAALGALDGQRGSYAAQLEANRARLLDEVLRLEIVAGVDSGAEFARERLKMQVEVLQSSLKSGQKPLTQAAQYLQLCAMPALADDRTASRIEQLFRRIGAAEAK